MFMSGQTEVTLPSMVSYHLCNDAEFFTAQSTVMEPAVPTSTPGGCWEDTQGLKGTNSQLWPQ